MTTEDRMQDQQTEGPGPEFQQLVADLRTLDVTKRREQGAAVVAKAVALQREGRLTAADVALIHAQFLRLEGGK